LIGVVIPTLNEAETLPALLDDLRRLPIALDVVVADGDSTDGTRACAAAAGARVVSAPRGRARQLNAGAREAQGDWLLFLHADSRLPPAARRALLAAMVDDPELRARVFRFSIDLPAGWKRFVEWGQRVREALSGLSYGDQGLLLRRDLFQLVGGFPDIPVMEDVAMIRRLRRRVRVVPLEAAIRTSGRRYRRNGVLRTWLEHSLLLSLYLAGVSPQRLARWRRAERSTG